MAVSFCKHLCIANAAIGLGFLKNILNISHKYIAVYFLHMNQ